ncbi:MmpS family transport accessory protein [Mycobacterium servetii]|uniref:MmpS family transport accessory protein n=1 Tax=Mycobacterium servetii TaxID=3237418 RepID=A0ABV4C4G2_9MYCO
MLRNYPKRCGRGAPGRTDTVTVGQHDAHVKQTQGHYEALSRSNAEITISYLDETGQTRLYIGASPWSITVKTSDIGFAAGATAVSADGPLTCRIRVDGRLAD